MAIDSSGTLQSSTGSPVSAVGDAFVVHFPVLPEAALKATLGVLAGTVRPR